jgi:hypothetical protein
MKYLHALCALGAEAGSSVFMQQDAAGHRSTVMKAVYIAKALRDGEETAPMPDR